VVKRVQYCAHARARAVSATECGMYFEGCEGQAIHTVGRERVISRYVASEHLTRRAMGFRGPLINWTIPHHNHATVRASSAESDERSGEQHVLLPGNWGRSPESRIGLRSDARRVPCLAMMDRFMRSPAAAGCRAPRSASSKNFEFLRRLAITFHAYVFHASFGDKCVPERQCVWRAYIVCVPRQV